MLRLITQSDLYHHPPYHSAPNPKPLSGISGFKQRSVHETNTMPQKELSAKN
jgi:hypothetical protein